MDKRELADLDLWLNRRHDQEAELQAFKEDKNDPEYAPYIDQLERDIAHTKRILEIINAALAMRAPSESINRRMSQLDLK